MTSRSILIVSGDAALHEALREQLELHDEYKIQAVESHAAEAALAGRAFDMVLLDARDENDCARLRAAGFDGPVLALTLEAGEAMEAALAAAGADAVMAKPFRFSALNARMRQLIRARERNEGAEIAIGPYVFTPAAKTLTDGAGRRIRLTEKETDILRYLHSARAGEGTVGREELLTEVWGYNSGVTTHTLETHIYRLRQKMEDDPSNAALLVTDTGGYRLVP
jgi:DNA-binding response OmpR family regulator